MAKTEDKLAETVSRWQRSAVCYFARSEQEPDPPGRKFYQSTAMAYANCAADLKRTIALISQEEMDTNCAIPSEGAASLFHRLAQRCELGEIEVLRFRLQSESVETTTESNTMRTFKAISRTVTVKYKDTTEGSRLG